MAKRSVALTPKDFETLGRLLAQDAEIATCRWRGAGKTIPDEAIGWGVTHALDGEMGRVDWPGRGGQRRRDKVAALIRRHLDARFLARNGGWRPLQPNSLLAREVQIHAKESRIHERAQRALRRVTT
jgi:hypothetical protein